jgi:4-hydroxy-tetrahydrodipicolinate reductase
MAKAAKQSASLWLNGSSGRMGLEIQKALLAGPSPFRLVGGSALTFEGETLHQGRNVTPELLAQALVKGKVDVIVDFSTPEGNDVLYAALAKAEAKGLRVLIGTTGLGDKRLEAWKKLAKSRGLALLIAPNTSLGVLITVKAALTAAAPLVARGFDVEIVETHHKNKKDAPSGTAKFMADTLAASLPGKKVVTERDGARQPHEIGVHAVRGGGVFGEHEIRLIGEHEEVTVAHRAFSRALFASGALVLAGWLATQKPGVYGLLDVSV